MLNCTSANSTLIIQHSKFPPMKPTILLLLAFIIVLIGTGILFAQPPGLPATPDQAPIDGGLGLLAAAGGSYALKKLRDQKKATENQRL